MTHWTCSAHRGHFSKEKTCFLLSAWESSRDVKGTALSEKVADDVAKKTRIKGEKRREQTGKKENGIKEEREGKMKGEKKTKSEGGEKREDGKKKEKSLAIKILKQSFLKELNYSRYKNLPFPVTLLTCQ